jgi:hypothetical protein
MPDITLSGVKIVWDMLVGLIQGYSKRQADLFQQHVEPLHARMQEIHKDYLKGFVELRAHLTDRSVPPAHIIEFLKDRRREYAAERDLADKLSKELEKADLLTANDSVATAVKEYCRAITRYFSSASEIGGLSWYTDFIQDVEARVRLEIRDVWGTLAISGNPRRELLEKVDWTLNEGLAKALSPVNAYYAVLRTKLI